MVIDFRHPRTRRRRLGRCVIVSAAMRIMRRVRVRMAVRPVVMLML